MSVTVCTKCKGPVTDEDGKYVCALCGEAYGEAEKPEDYSAFFEKTSLEKLRRISRKLADTVVIRSGYYVIAPLSNGQFYTRFTPLSGQCSVYRGQCAAENWFNVKKIFTDWEYTVAIGDDGSLQPTLIEVEQLFDRIRNSGVSDMRMKDIVYLSYEHTSQFLGSIYKIEDGFLGLDINGKVVVYNPYKVFNLIRDDKTDQEKCVTLLKQIRSWPAIEKLTMDHSILTGITKEGKVYETLESPVSQWDNVDSIVECTVKSSNYEYSTVSIGLKKDGTIVACGNEESLSVCLPDVKKDLSRYNGIVQIANINVKGNDALAVLRCNGELIFKGTIIDSNVIAILENGYVRADGIVYERIRDNDKLEYKAIEGLTLFSSIYMIEEEYDECMNYKEKLENEKLRIAAEIESKRSELNPIQKQYADLGLFKSKERKALRPSIDALSNEIKVLDEEYKELEEKLISIPNGKAAWKHFDLPKNGSYSVSEISAAAYNAISYKKRDTSVLGSAAVGAVVAGPAGAIVGAIYAADKNRKNS